MKTEILEKKSRLPDAIDHSPVGGLPQRSFEVLPVVSTTAKEGFPGLELAKNKVLGPYIGHVPIRILLEELLNMPYDGDIDQFKGLSKRDVMVIVQIESACKGDIEAFREIMNRLYGKPMQFSAGIQAKGSIAELLEALPDD